MPRRFLLPASGLLAATVALSGLVVSPAHASANASAQIFLRPGNAHLLHRLAFATGLDHRQRVRRLERALPQMKARRAVEQQLNSSGFTVVGQSAWTVTFDGPAERVAADFGQAALSGDPGPTPASLPVGLRRFAQGVFPLSAAATATQPETSFSGPDFRNAYTAPNVTPFDGSGSTPPLTVAIVNLSQYSNGDLTQFAEQNDLPDPVADGQYTPINLNGTNPNPPYTTGTYEPDLDTETVYSTDPDANIRQYLSVGTGVMPPVEQVLDDVTQDSNAIDGGDPHIGALTLSYGMCEQQQSEQYLAGFNDLLASLDAAGVTVFSSSGDQGAYKCGAAADGTGEVGTTFPASSPYVVAVGGTALSVSGASAPNTGSNWSETAWTCASATYSDCHGSGGGLSSFAAPAYQARTVLDAPFAGASGRLVPDISADAAPSTGFPVVSSYCSAGTSYCEKNIGGTSLAAPLSAALFTTMLSHYGLTSGIGDIHGGLYSAYLQRPKADFRDITTGSNGSSSDQGNDPSVSAQPGYDTVTGLGSPYWTVLQPYLISPQRPNVTASLTRVHGTNNLSAHFSVHPADPGLVVRDTALTIVNDTKDKVVYQADKTFYDGSGTIGLKNVKPGSRLTFTVTSTDIADHQVTKQSSFRLPTS